MHNDNALFKNHDITGIGLCVPDVIATARQYGQLLGVAPWHFYDQCLDDGRYVRRATGQIGSLSVELRQPLDSEFVNRFHHISLGPIEDFGGVLEDARDLAVDVDLQTDGATGSCHALLDTSDSLGAQLEFHKVNDQPHEPFAQYQPESASLVKIGDREIVQLGIVVDDVQRFADGYSKLFGIENWSFLEFTPTPEWRGVYRDLPLAGAQFHIKAGLAMHGDMQIELLQPVSGISTHMDFLRRHGCGVHHLSFGPIADHDELVSKLNEAGLEVEMAGEVGTGAWFTYFRSAERLGTILEMVGSAAD